MLLAVRISSYGCTWEVWRALKQPELLSAAPRATLTDLSCSPNFPSASITRYTHAKHEQILNFTCVQKDKQTLKTKGTLYKLDKFPNTDQFEVFFQLNVSSFYGRLFGGEASMFPCSLYKFIAVPLFLKNFLRCSPKFILLSSHVPRIYAPCSLDPPKYSSLFPTISLMFHFHFHLIKRLPCHYFKKVSL